MNKYDLKRLEAHGISVNDCGLHVLDEATLAQLADALDAAVNTRRAQLLIGLEQATQLLPWPVWRHFSKTWEMQ